MSRAGKIVTALVTAGAAAGGFLYYRSLKRTGEELEVTHRVTVASLSLTALTLRIDITIRNPTPNGFSIKFPYIRLEMNGSPIGNSEVVDKVIDIPSQGEVHISNITIPISTLEELSVLASIISPLNAGQSVQIEVISDTAIRVLGIFSIPYSKTETITINNINHAS